MDNRNEEELRESFLNQPLMPYIGAKLSTISPGQASIEIVYQKKIIFILFIFLWVRASTPRYRYDQLMRLGWKIFLPFSLIWVVLTAGFLVFF